MHDLRSSTYVWCTINTTKGFGWEEVHLAVVGSMLAAPEVRCKCCTGWAQQVGVLQVLGPHSCHDMAAALGAGHTPVAEVDRMVAAAATDVVQEVVAGTAHIHFAEVQEEVLHSSYKKVLVVRVVLEQHGVFDRYWADMRTLKADWHQVTCRTGAVLPCSLALPCDAAPSPASCRHAVGPEYMHSRCTAADAASRLPADAETIQQVCLFCKDEQLQAWFELLHNLVATGLEVIWPVQHEQTGYPCIS